MNNRTLYSYHTDGYKEIETLLKKVKTITIPQFNLLLQDYKYTPDSVMHALQSNAIIEKKDNYITRFKRPSCERKDIECLWIALDLLQKEDGSIAKYDIDCITVGTDIINFSFILDRQLVVNVVNISSGESAIVNGVIQRFYNVTNCEVGKEEETQIVHLFCTSDADAFAMLQDMNIRIPHKIAFIEGDCIEKPEITYI